MKKENFNYFNSIFHETTCWTIFYLCLTFKTVKQYEVRIVVGANFAYKWKFSPKWQSIPIHHSIPYTESILSIRFFSTHLFMLPELVDGSLL